MPYETLGKNDRAVIDRIMLESVEVNAAQAQKAVEDAEDAYFLSLEDDIDYGDDGDLSEELYDADKALENGLIDKVEHERLCVKAFGAFDAQEIPF